MIFRSEFDNFVNMKNLLTTLTVLVCLLMGGAEADAARRGDREFKVYGPQGGIAMDVTLPDGVDPADPPEYVKCFGMMKLGREYILTTQELDIYGTAKAYTGPVRLIHGSKDTIVPMSCSKRFVETYGERSELIVVEGENHMITLRKKKTVDLAVEFFRDLWN